MKVSIPRTPETKLEASGTPEGLYVLMKTTILWSKLWSGAYNFLMFINRYNKVYKKDYMQMFTNIISYLAFYACKYFIYIL